MKRILRTVLGVYVGVVIGCDAAPSDAPVLAPDEVAPPADDAGDTRDDSPDITAEDPPGGDDPAADGAEPARTQLVDEPGVLPGDPEVLALDGISSMGYGRFVTSTACMMCHSNDALASAMRDSTGAEIAPYNLWQGSMMANSARDPFWHAMVSIEASATEGRREEIEANCMRCHAPMASESARKMLGRAPRMADLRESTGVGQLGRDGVACAACHQIQPSAALGSQASFSGGFEIGDRRVIFGPHRNPATGPMQVHVDYTPTFGPHMTTSKVCATCHTLVTHAFTPEGEELTDKPFVEQAAFLEWENSDYYDRDGRREEGQSCQDCHMPTVDDQGRIITTRIARSPHGTDFNINERKPFGRHVFLGANTVMPRLIRAQRSVLRPQGSDASLERTAERNKQRLQRDTASVEVTDIKQDAGRLTFDVEVSSTVGHKFPTGFPARRVWLKVEVLDAAGKSLFRSGGYSFRGRILDGAGDLLDVEKTGGGVEPHRQVISRDDHVQIYESVMAGVDGKRTILLTRATEYLKDNRILPSGFSDEHFNYRATKPVGVDDDGDFEGGGDVTRYDVDLKGAQAVQVVVSLVYQSLGGRFMIDLFKHDTPEVAAFRGMYDDVDVSPVTVSSVTMDIKPAQAWD